MEPLQVVIMSTPDRKLDNLLTILESIDAPLTIKTVESFQAVSAAINYHQPSILLIDFRNPKKNMEEEIVGLILNFTDIHVVLLKNRNAPVSHINQINLSEVVYDDLSVNYFLDFIFLNLKNKLSNNKNIGENWRIDESTK